MLGMYLSVCMHSDIFTAACTIIGILKPIENSVPLYIPTDTSIALISNTWTNYIFAHSRAHQLNATAAVAIYSLLYKYIFINMYIILNSIGWCDLVLTNINNDSTEIALYLIIDEIQLGKYNKKECIDWVELHTISSIPCGTSALM